MNVFEAVISGIIQGITEFLPVSSSGHLVILHNLIGLKEPEIEFDIFLHVGTLAAIFIVFWRDIIVILKKEKRWAGFILLASAATALFVLIFHGSIESMFSNVKLVGAMLLVTGAWLIFGSFVRFGTEGMTGLKAVFIGCAQGIAAFPGISRSGATIATALFLGLDAKSAARFSFLLAIPAITGAFLFKLKHGIPAGFNANYIFGFMASCIVGIIALKLLLKTLYSNRFHFYGIYCILVGIMAILFL